MLRIVALIAAVLRRWKERGRHDPCSPVVASPQTGRTVARRGRDGLTPTERERIDHHGRGIFGGPNAVLTALSDRRRDRIAATHDVMVMMLAEQARTMTDAERAQLFLTNGGDDAGAADLARRV